VVLPRLFIDTSFAIALLIPRDQYYGRATALYREIIAHRNQLVTTRAVLLEVGNALSRLDLRRAAATFLTNIETANTATIIESDAHQYSRALILFAQHADQEWSLTDCLSFVVMRDLGLTEALTADRHFVQAGFRALLLDETPPS
jgi:predicted nucleic acid-binding protein